MLDTKTMLILHNKYSNYDYCDDDGGSQEPRPNPTHELRCTEGAHHHIWGNQHILNCSLLQITSDHKTILDCCWNWNISLQALLEEEEDQLKGFFIFRTTFRTTLNLALRVTRTGFTYIFDCSGLSLSHLSIWSPAEVSFEFRNFGNLLTWTCQLWSLWWNE